MTTDPPSPAPAAVMIRDLRRSRIPRMSIPAAAKRAGVSPETWGMYERGYQATGAGKPPRPVIPAADTLARMGFAVGATPEALEQAGAAEAAGLLRLILRRESPAAAPPPLVADHLADPEVAKLWSVEALAPHVRAGYVADYLIALAVRDHAAVTAAGWAVDAVERDRACNAR